MLTLEERNLIYQRAYLPEHLPDYVESISGAEAHIHYDHLCYTAGNHLIFIGYPLVAQSNTQQAYESVCNRFQPVIVAVIAPQLWFSSQACQNWSEDVYYQLGLPLPHFHPEVAYMVRRAARELQVVQGKFSQEHQKLVNEFLSKHKLTQQQRLVFEGMPHYLARSETARLLEARRQNGVLVAFNVIDLGAAEYAFYLFNFRSTKEKVPGASDLLFHKMVGLAQEEGKKAINLGLGIHPGVSHFKEKWGATPFLPYTSCLLRRQPERMEGLLEKL
ncbi:MAG: hypothetical protein ACE5LA_00690 [Dehalococcoidales bacterium]